jgi:hypothetical protein
MRVPVLAVELKLERVLEEAWEGVGAPWLVMAQVAACLQPRRWTVHAVGPDCGDACGVHCGGRMSSFDAASDDFFLMGRLVVKCQAGLKSFHHTAIV